MTARSKKAADAWPLADDEQADSGLSSLWLVASVLGARLDVNRMRHEHISFGDKAKAEDLVRIARSEGLKARWTKAAVRRLTSLPLPAIAAAKDGSFFVIARAVEGKALVAEAGQPPAEWSLDQLEQAWAGDVILVAKREPLGGDALRFGLAWFLPVVKSFRNVLAEVLLISVFIQLIGLVAPLFFQVVIDKVLVHRGLATLEVLVIGLVVVNIGDISLNWLRTYAFAHTTSRMDAILGSLLFKHLIALPISYFENRATGQTVARVRELENVRQFITSSALTLVIDVLFGFIFLAVMFYYSPSLTLIVVLSIPCYAIISVAVTPGLQARVKEKFHRGAANQSLLVESLSGMQTLKAMAVEPQMRQRWEQQLAAYISASLKVVTLGAGGAQLVALVNKLATAAILWFGARAVIDNTMTIGELVAFNMLAAQISAPVLRLAQLWQDFQQFKLSIDRLGDIINTPTENHAAAAKLDLPPIQGRVSFDSILFRYKPGGQEVLRDLSLDIAAGEVVGIVGRSGSGKSTLTKLLQRLYAPERGRILVDGVDIGLLDPSWLRRQIGVVLQENMLFNRAVRENIALANPALALEDVIRCAELAGAHEFILELPHGYDTILEERGANLSGGQRQRIAIARALVTNPRILIFDEATSALDYESEQIIQANMRSICKGRTVLIVAHRLSTVRHADRILVLERGQLAEAGSHEALMQANGVWSWNFGGERGGDERQWPGAVQCRFNRYCHLRPNADRRLCTAGRRRDADAGAARCRRELSDLRRRDGAHTERLRRLRARRPAYPRWPDGA
ncbi:type I secretion system permease/ATPase [Methylocapsa acidiphila]|uniref:type I secretion system permease/ATPase n=1 Tax=Methylocapsa acidiphila TaxID=133552 RepID=UPI000A05F1CD